MDDPGKSPPPPPRGKGAARDEIINIEALRRAIRSADPALLESSRTRHEIPAHLAHARRAYLAALIDELGGDLSVIARFWDGASEKTLRRLIGEYGLGERLKAARARARRS